MEPTFPLYQPVSIKRRTTEEALRRRLEALVEAVDDHLKKPESKMGLNRLVFEMLQAKTALEEGT